MLALEADGPRLNSCSDTSKLCDFEQIVRLSPAQFPSTYMGRRTRPVTPGWEDGCEDYMPDTWLVLISCCCWYIIITAGCAGKLHPVLP